MNDQQVLLSVIIISVVTAAIRFLPFLLFSGKKTPKLITRLGDSLPYAVMGMLVVYCLKDTGFQTPAQYVPQLISVIVVGVLYVWKKNTLLSILSGTICYMLLVQWVFV